MCAKRIEGLLTQIEVQLLFKINEILRETFFPPRPEKLTTLGGKEYARTTILYHLQNLEKWGYVEREPSEPHRSFWKLTSKGYDLVDGNNPNIIIEGKGEIR